MDPFIRKASIDVLSLMELDVAPDAMIDTLLDSATIAINFDDLRLQYRDTSPEGRRVAPRYEIGIEIIILSQTKSFRTSSINVSISGALLKDQLPKEFMSSDTLDIIFIPNGSFLKKRILFQGKAVGGPDSSARITFQRSSLNAQTDLLMAIEKIQPLKKKRA